MHSKLRAPDPESSTCHIWAGATLYHCCFICCSCRADLISWQDKLFAASLSSSVFVFVRFQFSKRLLRSPKGGGGILWVRYRHGVPIGRKC